MVGGRAGSGALLFALSVVQLSCQASDRTAALAFRDVRVFDGKRTIARATVLVEDGYIAGVGSDVAIPSGARVIDGEGQTLLPGLIDAHVHLQPGVLRRALMFGVTTELSMGSDPEQVAGLKEAQTDDGAVDRADYFGSLQGVSRRSLGPPGGPEDAAAFVEARVEEGADHIKIFYEYGSSEQEALDPNPLLEEPVMRAAVGAAHDHGKVVSVHVNSLEAAKEVAAAGADVLAHVFFEQVADDEVIRLLLENGTYVTPTFSVHERMFHESEWTEADDPRVAPYLGPDEVGMLRSLGGRERPEWTNMVESVRVLHAAGVPMLAGTDMPQLQGLTMHRELETLVSAGLDPADALIAATSAPADAFGLADRGRIVPGARADLLLVRGDPTINITVTRDIVGVWKLGVEADRAGYAEEKRALFRMLESDDDLVIADFETGEPVPTFGSLFEEVTPGSGSVEMHIIDGGAAGSQHALSMSGTVVEAEGGWTNSRRWYGDHAGVVFRPTLRFSGGTMDLSTRAEISFWARGDGATYNVLLFSRSTGPTPIVRMFEAGPEWAEFTFPLSSFEGADPANLRRISFAAGPEPGDFRFDIDEIRMR